MKIAVVLLNMGGPDNLAAVRPFLFNLFNDRSIINMGQPFRWLLAQYISRRRAPVARRIYDRIGGKSPLLEMTEKQAAALQRQLGDGQNFRVFTTMRYWHPMSDGTARLVKQYGPERIVLLPLYPQFSTATTGSSLAEWNRAAARAGLDAPSTGVCCYPENSGFIETMSRLTAQSIAEASAKGKPMVLFSAHGLPQEMIDAGDPYARQVRLTVEAIVGKLAMDDLDWVICYQSRIGRRRWIGPSTEDEIGRAAAAGRPLVVVPVAFVSEHSETLVELDMEYRRVAENLGAVAYLRTPTAGHDRAFIGGLKELVLTALKNDHAAVIPGGGKLACRADCPACPAVRANNYGK